MPSANRLPLVVATRSADKLREIAAILAPFPFVELQSLRDAGLPPEPVEDTIEVFDTFQENALAKARHFANRLRVPVLADDSGLCVDALRGAPGVHSKRYADRRAFPHLSVDAGNNRKLLEQLRGVPAAARTARYVCAAAVVIPHTGAEYITHGTCEGVILPEPAGSGGFGYDPLFYLPSHGCTFGEMDPVQKNRISHRAAAMTTVAEALRTGVDREAGHA